MLVVLLERILLAAEVIVENDLLFEVVAHLRANAIRLVDALSDRAVTRLELIECLDLLLQISRLKNELVRRRVLHQQLPLRLSLRYDFLKTVHTESFFKGSDTLDVVCIALGLFAGAKIRISSKSGQNGYLRGGGSQPRSRPGRLGSDSCGSRANGSLA